MLQALKARMQAIREIRIAEIEAQRKKAIEIFEIAHAELAIKHDIQIAMAKAELQMARNRLEDR